jgi:hypothetical protein
MKRERFTREQVGETFLHAYAYHMCDAGPGEEYEAREQVLHGTEREAGVFDLPSEAKKAARAAMRTAVKETGSEQWIWCVDRKELCAGRFLLSGGTTTVGTSMWGNTTERWSNCGGHETGDFGE